MGCQSHVTICLATMIHHMCVLWQPVLFLVGHKLIRSCLPVTFTPSHFIIPFLSISERELSLRRMKGDIFMMSFSQPRFVKPR